MGTKEQELVMTNGHKESLLQEDIGEFKITPSQIKEIMHMDSRATKEGSDAAISSDLIVNRYGGIQGIAEGLLSNLKTGISGTKEDIANRQRVYGKNSFPPPHIKSIWELIAENFEDVINQILCAAAIVSIIIGYIQHGFPEGLIEGTSILIALNIIITVNSGNNYMSEKRLADLVNLSEKQEVAVFRGSTATETIDAEDLVVGDLVLISQGMKVPAELIMVSGQDITCDEAALTGEPDACPKYVVTAENLQDHSVMYAKSLMQTGTGTAIVMSVGTNTAAGKITEQTQDKESGPTHLQRKLEVIADKIGKVGIACALLTFCAMVIRTALEMVDLIPCGCENVFTCHQPPAGTCVKPNFEFTMKNPLWNMLLQTVIIAITVIVVAIPEGLPLAVTISLSFASKKMQKENNLVRTLSSAETMGGATHICSDKTGTLTQNKMTVMAVMANCEGHFMGTAISNKLAEDTKKATADNGTWQMLIEGLFWNSSARIEANNDPLTNKETPFNLEGNVTEQGIIKFFMGILGGQECLDQRNRLTEDNTLALISFSSSRKRASIITRDPAKAGAGDEVRIYCKGAPDMLFDRTTNVITADGSSANFDDSTTIPSNLTPDGSADTVGTYRNLYESTVKTFACQAYRTILMTYRDMSLAEFEQIKADNNNFEKESDREVLEQGLTAYGIFGLQDPLRETIVSSINKCRTAGITTIMCTGDNIDTATAISKNAGIVTQQMIDDSEESQLYSCMTGKDFRTEVGGLMKEETVVDGKKKTIEHVANMGKFNKIIPYLRVLARSSPEDKRILVTGIMENGGVVAVTGDGTNDAPALTKADVGFAMGITGTDVAKGACDIILLDDNFSSIITALRYGRNVFDNVRKFLQFQLTVNVVAMFIVFFGSVIIKDSPLNAVQMLWVNLIMDTFAALALATEPPADDILTRQPYNKDAPIMTEVMWRNVFGHAIYQIIVLVVVIFAAQGTVVANYSDECFDYKLSQQSPPVYQYAACNLKQGTDQSTWTSIYNPFYTKHLYIDKQDIEAWGAIKTDNGKSSLQKANFDQALLNDFSCFVYQQSHAENTLTCAQLQKGADWAKHIVTPADVPNMTETMKLLHFTYVFQIFVFMQLFNQFNARLLEDGEFNIFSGVFRNCIFIFISLLTFVVQVAMVEVGGQITKCFPLNTQQNLICVAFGAFELIWGYIIKLTPLSLWQCMQINDVPDDEEQSKPNMIGALKASSYAGKRKMTGDEMNNKLQSVLQQRVNEKANQLSINN